MTSGAFSRPLAASVPLSRRIRLPAAPNASTWPSVSRLAWVTSTLPVKLLAPLSAMSAAEKPARPTTRLPWPPSVPSSVPNKGRSVPPLPRSTVLPAAVSSEVTVRRWPSSASWAPLSTRTRLRVPRASSVPSASVPCSTRTGLSPPVWVLAVFNVQVPAPALVMSSPSIAWLNTTSKPLVSTVMRRKLVLRLAAMSRWPLATRVPGSTARALFPAVRPMLSTPPAAPSRASLSITSTAASPAAVPASATPPVWLALPVRV